MLHAWISADFLRAAPTSSPMSAVPTSSPAPASPPPGAQVVPGIAGSSRPPRPALTTACSPRPAVGSRILTTAPSASWPIAPGLARQLTPCRAPRRTANPALGRARTAAARHPCHHRPRDPMSAPPFTLLRNAAGLQFRAAVVRQPAPHPGRWPDAQPLSRHRGWKAGSQPPGSHANGRTTRPAWAGLAAELPDRAPRPARPRALGPAAAAPEPHPAPREPGLGLAGWSSATSAPSPSRPRW